MRSNTNINNKVFFLNNIYKLLYTLFYNCNYYKFIRGCHYNFKFYNCIKTVEKVPFNALYKLYTIKLYKVPYATQFTTYNATKISRNLFYSYSSSRSERAKLVYRMSTWTPK